MSISWMSGKISFVEIPVVNVNSAYPDQTPRSVVSDLGLGSPITLLEVSRLKWVKVRAIPRFQERARSLQYRRPA